ncbi:hypothetical protein Mesil_2479 [Allomeiothermus silvanus DSM 9946]|uniref:Uncharacterized protein n=1 Tax=Allomeiothermus silvanus (strain ATCC 700542 / DSM 9946 / NBRC 106475 / NCIMB 13440 / VI-R2) TaxID=526227 RepID=D7BAV8_ALLS1|nr:hypothetical protein Mesil_2479 [Allomeiothermus silvanus DSM 9946]
MRNAERKAQAMIHRPPSSFSDWVVAFSMGRLAFCEARRASYD